MITKVDIPRKYNTHRYYTDFNVSVQHTAGKIFVIMIFFVS